MVRFGFVGLTLVALTILVAMGRTEERRSAKGSFHCPAAPICQPTAPCSNPPTAAERLTCVTYSLGDLGGEAEFGKWVAQTIPQVIEPGSWNLSPTTGNSRVLRYYGPKKILVVYHTPAVQTKVDAFLKTLKKALPRETGNKVAARNRFTQDRKVVPARYLAPGVILPPAPSPEPNATYPVPAPVQPPKHLFHLIIRYEGAGIIDSNVVKFMKLETEQKPASSEEEKKEETPEKDKKEKDEKETNGTVVGAVPTAPVAGEAVGVGPSRVPDTGSKPGAKAATEKTKPTSHPRVEIERPPDKKEKEEKKP